MIFTFVLIVQFHFFNQGGEPFRIQMITLPNAFFKCIECELRPSVISQCLHWSFMLWMEQQLQPNGSNGLIATKPPCVPCAALRCVLVWLESRSLVRLGRAMCSKARVPDRNVNGGTRGWIRAFGKERTHQVCLEWADGLPIRSFPSVTPREPWPQAYGRLLALCQAVAWAKASQTSLSQLDHSYTFRFRSDGSFWKDQYDMKSTANKCSNAI